MMLKDRDGDDAFFDIRFWCFASLDASGEVFDVVLIFTGVV